MVTKVLGTCCFQLHTKMEASSSRQLATTVTAHETSVSDDSPQSEMSPPRNHASYLKKSCRVCGQTYIYDLHRLHVYLSWFIVIAIKRTVKYQSAVLPFDIRQNSQQISPIFRFIFNRRTLSTMSPIFRRSKTTQIPSTLFSAALVSLLPGTFAKPSRL